MDQFVFIALLLEEDYNRRNLRDNTNPFEMPDYHFKQMFRLDKLLCQNLIDSLENYVIVTRIPLHIKILATLNFVSTGSYQNSVASNYWISLSQPSLSKITMEVCTAISNNLLQEWVKFPTTIENQNIVKQGFFGKWGARSVIGAIDETHVDILTPPMDDNIHPPFAYTNRKGKHSINVMLISVCNSKILAVNARHPGSVHDAAIWQLSTIKQFLMQEHQNGNDSSHLIGDSGYPLEPWLFTPIANAEVDSPEYFFNKELTSMRNVIERTNGILKGRFRCLSRQRILMYHPVRAANIIYTCCVLHNMAINLPIQEEQIEYRDNNEDHDNNANINGNVVFLQGRAKRNKYIADNIRQY